ncbi:MAG: methyltransferase, partial [Planctomycetes bacterium]|nr:methyltransferase [Planctomycetota bacterium]
MSKAFFDLERIDPDGLRRLGGILRALGYTEQGVRERLSLKDITGIELGAYPYYLNYRLRRRAPLDLAIMLFLLQGVITEEELKDLFDAEARKVLRAARLLKRDPKARTYRARVSLYPVGEQLFFTDHRYAHHPWVKARVPRDPVMYLGADSYYLTRTTLRRPIRAALDLCAGSGVHGVLAAASAERSVGVDVSGRAVNFARLNAMLNDAWNAVFVEGDLYSPVGGERFDLILANPPFVPAPVYELTYRDGGPSGADVLRRIIASLPDHLAQDGVAQIVTHVAEREGESYLERVRRWLVGANINMHALRVGEEDVVDYAVAHTRRVFGEQYDRYAGKLLEWVTNLRSQRFQRVVGVVFTFQWNDEAPHPPWTQEDEAKPPTRDMSGEIARLVSAKRRVRRIPSLQALDRMRVGVPDDILLLERRRPTGSGFETKDFRVVFRSALMSPELDIKPLVRDLLERVDNRSTVPQVIARLARDTGQSVAELDDRCRRAFLIMLERGLVTLDEVVADAGEAPDLVRPASVADAPPIVVTPREAVGAPRPAAPAAEPLFDPELGQQFRGAPGDVVSPTAGPARTLADPF